MLCIFTEAALPENQENRNREAGIFFFVNRGPAEAGLLLVLSLRNFSEECCG
jgi:hypothetical protein